YQVWLAVKGRDWKPVFAADPATADAVLAGRNVSVAPHNGTFRIIVSEDNRTLGRAPVPRDGATAEVGGINFTRDGRKVTAAVNRTRVPIATREKYN
ncbi:MAG: rhomboid-like intramembrane serine protease, partial [Halobacteriaceae archaeon]